MKRLVGNSLQNRMWWGGQPTIPRREKRQSSLQNHSRPKCVSASVTCQRVTVCVTLHCQASESRCPCLPQGGRTFLSLMSRYLPPTGTSPGRCSQDKQKTPFPIQGHLGPDLCLPSHNPQPHSSKDMWPPSGQGQVCPLST